MGLGADTSVARLLCLLRPDHLLPSTRHADRVGTIVGQRGGAAARDRQGAHIRFTIMFYAL